MAACSLSIYAVDRGWSARPSDAAQRAGRRRLRGVGHRHRHSAGKAEASSSRRSSRPTPAPAASTAAPASAWPSAASWRTCSAAKFSSAARPGVGSTFTLYLPLKYSGPARRRRRRVAACVPRCRRRRRRARQRRDGRPSQCPTTATVSEPGDTVLLIVEDDPHYARITGRPGARPASRC